jgi:hypothetical protein
MSSKTSKQLILSIAAGMAVLLSSAPVMAEDDSEIRSSRSVTFSKQVLPGAGTKDTLLKQAELESFPVLTTEGFRLESTVKSALIVTTDYYSHGEVSVYDASTELISDFDHDGFFHRYSVAIDVDSIFDTSYIYARLYLSYQGGPWNYYASSDNYFIHGDSELDTFVIETELADGYPAGYYDLRIEIYDVETNTWLTSYGPYDDASLYALPLEDSYEDSLHELVYYPIETEVIVTSHGGALSWLLLTSPLLVWRLRSYVTKEYSVNN